MKRIGVLMGGISAEREVSLSSGKTILEYIDKTKYEASAIIINKPEDVFKLCQNIDFAFIGLHGKFGEDGRVQTILEAMNIPYTGCSPLGSTLAMDKDLTKKLVRAAGVRTANWKIVHNINEIDGLKEINYPVFVKPNSGGSSVATNLVKNKEELINAVNLALKYDDEIMIEEYIQGDEITIPIIDGETYPVVAIEPQGEFFCYEAKYDQEKGAREYVIKLEEPLNQEVIDMAMMVWKSLKLNAYARVDLIVKNNIPYFLEVNTLPGMTPTSLMPKSYISMGYHYQDLVTKIIDVSLNLKRR